MAKKRRRFTAEFKLKVILEALKERNTLSEIAQKYQLHQNQTSQWKTAFLAQAADYMSHKSINTKQQTDEEKLQLYAKIGQLQMELDFLKKKLC
ncbi:MAG: transposase [Bacteroidota bacterium]